jgi:hypothetical protein
MKEMRIHRSEKLRCADDLGQLANFFARIGSPLQVVIVEALSRGRTI